VGEKVGFVPGFATHGSSRLILAGATADPTLRVLIESFGWRELFHLGDAYYAVLLTELLRFNMP